MEVTDVVIDNGSSFIRAGFAGDDAPRASYPNKLISSAFKSSSLDSRIQNSNNTNDDDDQKQQQQQHRQHILH